MSVAAAGIQMVFSKRCLVSQAGSLTHSPFEIQVD
jgi:hypothetical protein